MNTFARFATDENLTVEQARALVESGKITATMLLQRSDSTEWKRATEYAELHSAFETAPKPLVRGTKPVRHFEPKFTQPEPPSMAVERFAGVWFVFIATWMLIGMPRGSIIEMAPFLLVLGVAEFIGIALIVAPEKAKKWLRSRDDDDS